MSRLFDCFFQMPLTDSERIRFLVELVPPHTQAALARALKVSPSCICNILKGREKISAKLAFTCQKAYRVDANWLLTGEGAPFHASVSLPTGPYERTWFDIPGHDPEELKKVAQHFSQIQAAAEVTPYGMLIIEPKYRELMEKAGGLEEFYCLPYTGTYEMLTSPVIPRYEIEGYCAVPKKASRAPENLRCVRIGDLSMKPALERGSIVAVDRSIRTGPEIEGQIVCARDHNKKIRFAHWHEQGRYVVLSFLNPYGEPIALAREKAYKGLIGMVVWTCRAFTPNREETEPQGKRKS